MRKDTIVKFKAFIGIIFIIALYSWSQGQADTDKDVAPEVYLNHLFVVVDSSTYEDIVTSDFIKNEWAHFEERTTVVGNNISYTGAYIYGENTYMEFFDSAKKPSSITPALTSGIAFGVDKKGKFKVIQKKLKEYKNAVSYLGTWELEGTQIPWYHAAFVFYGKAKRNIHTWIMEYHQDFLRKWHPELEPVSGGITRKDILKRYAAKITKPLQPGRKIFKDIIGINLRVNKEEIEKITGELDVFGYEMRQDGNRMIWHGPYIMLTIENTDEGEGRITGIEMRLNHNPHPKASFKFGESSRLIFHEDKTASWIFH